MLVCEPELPRGGVLRYKQGDGNVPIHDWALEETLSAVVMQVPRASMRTWR